MISKMEQQKQKMGYFAVAFTNILRLARSKRLTQRNKDTIGFIAVLGIMQAQKQLAK